jgi:hypothetical protein
MSLGLSTGPALAAVSSLGYLGFLAGPPVIGGAAQLTSLRVCLRRARPRGAADRRAGADGDAPAAALPSERATDVTPAALVARSEALLVDLDGTLVDSSGPVRRA